VPRGDIGLAVKPAKGYDKLATSYRHRERAQEQDLRTTTWTTSRRASAGRCATLNGSSTSATAASRRRSPAFAASARQRAPSGSVAVTVAGPGSTSGFSSTTLGRLLAGIATVSQRVAPRPGAMPQSDEDGDRG
jgi:hypothetical protein